MQAWHRAGVPLAPGLVLAALPNLSVIPTCLCSVLLMRYDPANFMEDVVVCWAWLDPEGDDGGWEVTVSLGRCKW